MWHYSSKIPASIYPEINEKWKERSIPDIERACRYMWLSVLFQIKDDMHNANKKGYYQTWKRTAQAYCMMEGNTDLELICEYLELDIGTIRHWLLDGVPLDRHHPHVITRKEINRRQAKRK